MADRTEVVARLYQAFANGDGDTLAKLLAETEWSEAAGMPYGGDYRGFAEVAANVFGPIGQDVQGFAAVPDEIMTAGDDRVLATGRYRGAGAGGAVDTPFAHLWTVDGDRISRFVQYADTYLYRRSIGL